MGNDVFANGREISCKSADGKAICAFPDVCFTPPETPVTPTGVPIPYPNTGFAKDTTSGSKRVKISGKEVMLKNKSFFKKSTGDEPGCAAKKGVITSVNRGKVYFNSWSMDVKVEGENVVRHLDLTTHNHNPRPGNTPPWPYTDSAALGPGGACAKEAEALEGKCSSPVERDTSATCCAVPQRQCVLVPKNKDKEMCCPNHGTTGHHVIPKQELCKKGTAGSPLDKNKDYNHNAAPCICADGGHPGRRDSNGNIKGHAIFHNAFKQGRTDHLSGGEEWDYTSCKKVSSQAAAKESGCSEGCIEHQVAQYHDGKVGEVRLSEQKSYDPKPRPQTDIPSFGG